jgi:threonine/homoserine/homoserine lactone efflux protein
MGRFAVHDQGKSIIPGRMQQKFHRNKKLASASACPYQGTMTNLLFLRGMVIGFALAAPVGPVGVLCIKRALADGRVAAFCAGLGAALADTIFGAVAGLGLTVVSSFLLLHQVMIRLVGGSFLIFVGVRGYGQQAVESEEEPSGAGLVKDFLASFMLAIANPATILAAIPLVAAVGAIGLRDKESASWLVIGVFSGSALWWLMLSAAAGAVRSRFSPKALTLLGRISSVLLSVTGTFILTSLVWGHFFK